MANGLGISLGVDDGKVKGVADVVSSGEISELFAAIGEVGEDVGDELTFEVLGFKALVGVATATAGEG